MENKGYWLHKNGILFDVTYSKHITFMINNPELFRLTKEEIEQCYSKHNERVGQEGKQREELIKSVYNQGWVRIRNYQRQGMWSVQTDNIDRRQRMLDDFFYKQSGEGIPVKKSPQQPEKKKKVMSPWDIVVLSDLKGTQKKLEVSKSYETLFESTVKNRIEFDFTIIENPTEFKKFLKEGSFTEMINSKKKKTILFESMELKNIMEI